MPDKPVILVVDDDVASRKVIEASLRKSGFETISASNGKEAIRCVKTESPNLILLDACMPEVDGFDTCQQLRDIYTDSVLPIFMMTGLTDDASIEKAFECGATDYLTKPINTKILIRRLHKQFIATKVEHLANPYKRELFDMLVRDIEAKNFEVVFQPKFFAATVSICGVEALLRWNPDEKGYVSPSEFIPLAVSGNLMRKLSNLVIEKSLNAVVYWNLKFGVDVPVAINLDAQDLADSSIISKLCELSESLNIPSHLIEVEITENMAVSADLAAVKNINKLQEKGFKITIDDFGTGYSSFEQLEALHVDCLKIDMTYVQKMGQNKKATNIVRGMINLAKQLQLSVVAEGIESLEQLKRLQEMKCDIIQGYYTGKPTRLEQFDMFLNDPQRTQHLRINKS